LMNNYHRKNQNYLRFLLLLFLYTQDFYSQLYRIQIL